jgi:hypothetical protein
MLGCLRVGLLWRRPKKPCHETTDNYGDFWLKDLPDGSYTLLIEKEDYLPKQVGPIDATEKDQNRGDIALRIGLGCSHTLTHTLAAYCPPYAAKVWDQQA